MASKNRNLWYLLCRLLWILPTNLFHNVVGWIMHKRFGIKYNWMNINNPITFSEKLQYLKKHPACNNASVLADKYLVRDFVKHRIGEEYLVPIIGVYKSVDEIDFDKLPNRFVMKLTKGSGYNLICQDKDKLNVEDTKKMLRRWLKVDVYKFSREDQYKGKSLLICEEMLEYNITDYKFFCFAGKPTYIELYMDRFGNHKKAFYDMQWNRMPFTTAGDICIDEDCCPHVVPETDIPGSWHFSYLNERLLFNDNSEEYHSEINKGYFVYRNANRKKVLLSAFTHPITFFEVLSDFITRKF